MAIHCMNPNTLGSLAEAMWKVTSVDGKALIDSFAETIVNLDNNWKGSDAVANLKDLNAVYTEVVNLVKSLEQLVVTVNNEEVLPLQRHIQISGGTCTIGNTLAPKLGNVSSSIAIQSEGLVSKTENGFIAIAEKFSSFPTEFTKFVSLLDEAKENLVRNWLDGANREAVISTYNKFKDNVQTYTAQLNRVRDNINVVKKTKQQLL